MEEYTSLNELYKSLIPVLKTKINEMKLRGIDYINEQDIWKFQTTKWSKSINLTFSDMVSDILNTSDSNYINYKKSVWKENKN